MDSLPPPPPATAEWRPWQLTLFGAIFAILAVELPWSFAHARFAVNETPLLAHCPLPIECPSPHVSTEPPAALASPPSYLKLPPGVKRVIINVGSNLQPPVPKEDDIAVIAVEPMLATAARIPKHERVFVVTAAVSNVVGFASFFSYNFNGESSSLAQMREEDAAAPSGWWAADNLREKGYAPVSFVPVLTLRMLLDAIPPEVEILLLKTDMQGFDFTAVSAVGSAALARVRQVYSEVNCHGFAYNPSAPLNDFDAVWADFMAQHQFVQDHSVMCPPQPCESNALWTRAGAAVAPGIWWD
jgi:hypothetical protein